MLVHIGYPWIGSCSNRMSPLYDQGPVEPMQIDGDPQDDQQNAPHPNYVVENASLVSCLISGIGLL